MTDLTRRRFLGALPIGLMGAHPMTRLLTGAATGRAPALSLFPPAAAGSLLTSDVSWAAHPTIAHDSKIDRYNPSVPGWLASWDPGSQIGKRISVPFFGHGISVQPKNKNVVFTSEKWGSEAALVDFASEKVLSHLILPRGRRFFGHSVYSISGDRIYTSEMDDFHRSGLIVARDAATLQEIAVFQTNGKFPHEVRFTNDRSALVTVVAINAETSRLVWLDPKSGKILQTKDLPLTQHGGQYGHFTFTADGYAIASGVYPGKAFVPPVMCVSPTGDLQQLKFPDLHVNWLKGEALSIAADVKSGIVGITVPDSHAVWFWNYRAGHFIKRLHVVLPKGIAFCASSNKFVVSLPPSQSFVAIDAASLEFTDEPLLKSANGIVGNGSHITVI